MEKGIFKMRIIKAKDYADMSRKAANIIAAQVILKPDCVLGLATGSTQIGTYKELIKGYENGDLDFSLVKTANLDEYRGLPKSNDQSYDYFMKDNLFNHININFENLNIPNGENPDAEAECARYEAVVKALGGQDLQLLGMGHNGHIGFNEPDSVYTKATHVVHLTESTIDANKRFFASADDVPRQALTMGMGCIMAARRVLLIANGEAKADAIYNAFSGPITPECPASILQLHPDVVVVCDEAALSKFLEAGGTVCK